MMFRLVGALISVVQIRLVPYTSRDQRIISLKAVQVELPSGKTVSTCYNVVFLYWYPHPGTVCHLWTTAHLVSLAQPCSFFVSSFGRP